MRKNFKLLEKTDPIYYFDGKEIITLTNHEKYRTEPYVYSINNEVFHVDPYSDICENREYKSLLSLKYSAISTDYELLKQTVYHEQSVLECNFKSRRVILN